MASETHERMATQEQSVTQGARVIAQPILDIGRRVELVAPHGASIGEIVSLAMPEATDEQRSLARVTIGDTLIPRDIWGFLKPKPNAVVVIRSVPGNGNLLRAALTVSVAVAAMALGQLYVGPMLLGAGGLGLTGLTLTSATSFVSGALVIAGTLLVNALVPARQNQNNSGGNQLPNYSVQGWKNGVNTDTPVPCILGKIRYAPSYAALPYTEASGLWNFVTAAFNFGYGPVVLSNLRIGDTFITKFIGVTYETRNGEAGDQPLTLYTTQVIEDRLNIELSQTRETTILPDRRFTAADATDCSVDITFPAGLTNFYQTGNPPATRQRAMTVQINISQRLETDAGFTLVAALPITNMISKAFTVTFAWKLPTRGRYEIQIDRVATDWDDLDQTVFKQQIISRTYWSAIRSHRPEYPINFPYPLALAAVRIQATGQLNGVLDNFNAFVSRKCLDWDSGTQTWILRETNNPASLFRFVLQSNAFAFPVADANLDLPQLQYWHEFCAARNLAYNRVHDFEATVVDVLADVAAAGRASPVDLGNKWSVVIDEIKTVVVAHISPRNSWGFSFERAYVRFPDAFRVKFQDETSLFGFTDAERIIPWPGFVGTPLLMEDLALPGITNPDLIWKEARRRQYELINRRNTYYVTMDFEALVARRGDLVKLSHDVINRTHVAARVKAVSGNAVTLDETVTMQRGQSYGIRFRSLPATDGVPDLSIVRTIQTVAGETNTLFVTGAGTLPNVGDLCFFGEAGIESIECIVLNMEAGNDLTVRLTLVDHAPQIQTLTDAEVPPPWNGRIGAPIGDPTTPPDVPVIGTIVSGRMAAEEPPITVKIPVFTGPTDLGRTDHFEVRHRIVGAPVWTTDTLSPASLYLVLAGVYAAGDVIEVNARAIGKGAPPLASAYTATVTHNVAATDHNMLAFNEPFNSMYLPIVG